jgi:two-component system, chemotaxis family, CheB/CheR fusion protein
MNEIEQLKKELTETKNALKDSQIMFNHIVESTFAGYFDWNIPENTEYLSPTFKKMFGYGDDEMESSPEAWQKIIFEEDLPKVFELFTLHVESKGKIPFDSELRFYHKDGSVVWIFCRGKVVEWDENGSPLRMLGSHIDITKLKKVEETKLYIEQLEQKNKELQQFAYVASHDLQEPLRTIISFTDLITDEYEEKLDENANTYLHYISSSSKRMSQLIKGLLDYTRIGKNFKVSTIDTNKVLKSVIDDLNKLINENEVIFEINPLPNLKGHGTELRSLFMNLITNAIKYKKKNEKPIIKIGATKEDNSWKFYVEDNGIGIEKTHEKRIFLIFQRLHNKDEYEGTGIGLAHCQKIVEIHGGKIWMESIPQIGSTFYFTIPI